jgi:hypothetical protein
VLSWHAHLGNRRALSRKFITRHQQFLIKTVPGIDRQNRDGHDLTLKARNGAQTPVLATILVGNDPSSAT